MIDETVIDTRKKDKNVVIISEEQYGEMEKAERNSVYLRKLDRGLTQVRAGHGVVKSMTELEAIKQNTIKMLRTERSCDNGKHKHQYPDGQRLKNAV